MLSEEYTKAMEFFTTDKLKCIDFMEKIIYDNKNKPSESLEPYLRLSELYRETNIEKSIELIEYVTYKTNDASILNNLAVLYTEGLRIDDAKRIYLRIINECKDHKTLHISLCNFNQMMDLYIYEFIAYIHLTLKLHPTLTDELSALIHQALLMEYNGIYSKDISSVINILEDNENKNKRERLFIDFRSLSPTNDIDIIYNEHLKINKYFKTRQQYDFKNRKKNSKIRIGYVSSDFRNHAVSKFMKNIILNHNKHLFEIYTYYVHSLYDHFTDIFKNNTNFKDISKLTVKQSCDIIYNDNIDILIDLNGHTGLNRIEIFAYKPAPIQINYLGYPNTTGLDEMDYRITDKIADPLDSKQKYSEQLLHLDTCFLNYSFPDYKYSSTSYNNNDDFIIYSITNRLRKQCPMFLQTVKTILKHKQNSKIKILIHSLPYKKQYIQSFYKQTLDIDDSRLEIITNLKEEFYFDYFNSVDVILDTFPYSAATIACDALYMSTPIITLSQPDSHVHNVSKTVLYNVAPELITYSIDEYINTAINMDKKLIKKYKSELHSKFCSSMDINNFMKTYENTLLKTLKYSSTNFFNSQNIITWEKLHSISDHFIDINISSNKFYDINNTTIPFNNNYIVFISSTALLNPNLYIHLHNFKNKFKIILYDTNHILTPSLFSQLKIIKNLQHIYTNYLPFTDILLTPIPSYTNDKLKILERINIKNKNDLIYSDSNSNTNYDQYLNILKLYKYAIYKESKDDSLWDYLNLNIIPICLKSPLTEYYSKHLPMILVNDFNEIDMIDLQTNYDKYKNGYKNKDVYIFKNLYSTIIV